MWAWQYSLIGIIKMLDCEGKFNLKRYLDNNYVVGFIFTHPFMGVYETNRT